MFKIITAAAVATAAFASSVAAQPMPRVDLARYDARAAQTLGERLVLCDLASYFATGPDLDAQRVYVRRDAFRFEPSFPTAITRGGHWHDGDLERAYQRYRAAGQVSTAEVDALRPRYGAEMERMFHRMNVGERRFFQAQASFCRDLARGSWRAAVR